MRGSTTDPNRAPGPARRVVGTLAGAALLLPLLGAAPSEAGPSASAGSSAGLQRAFASAAAEYHVPQSVLLGVSYLQSRWDAHAGAPSVTGGYGPMHLTDARTALTSAPHHSEGTEDARGDSARAALLPETRIPASTDLPARLETLPKAADLTGLSAGELRADPAANVMRRCRAAGRRPEGAGRAADPGPGGLVRRGGPFLRRGRHRDGGGVRERRLRRAPHRRGAHHRRFYQRIALAAQPKLAPDTAQLDRAGLRTLGSGSTECPKSVSCEWIPAPYKEFGDHDYGNHDVGDRPASQSIKYIVIHDTEGSWEGVLNLVQDPTYVSWNYTLRSTDGHIAQHVKAKDVAWHAGNWYINAKSIGLEHEGFLANPDAWYTEAMYRSSARLVKYLSAKYRIPLDRQHILGHDTVPGTTTSTIAGMHTDPGPYWDWRHYFELLGHPFKATMRPVGRPGDDPARLCGQPAAVHGLRHQGRALRVPRFERGAALLGARRERPLISDIGLGKAPTIGVNDLSSRVSTGQQYAVADRTGDWTAIWYLGQKAWFKNPRKSPAAVNASGLVVTPKEGRDSVPVYGRAYPEASAYPTGVPAQAVSPLPYKVLKDQRYVVGARVPGEYYYAVTFTTDSHRVVVGKDLYYEIQYGHRVAFVRAADVDVAPSVRR